MVQTISKELSAWLGEVKEQGRFRGRLAELFSDFGKGQAKPIDRELNAISEALGVSKFMALATLLVEGYTISGEEEIKPKFYEVVIEDEKCTMCLIKDGYYCQHLLETQPAIAQKSQKKKRRN